MRLVFVTLAIVLVLMVPTMIYVHMKTSGFRRSLEVVTILPIVIPPIVLILGRPRGRAALVEGVTVPAVAGLHRRACDAVRRSIDSTRVWVRST